MEDQNKLKLPIAATYLRKEIRWNPDGSKAFSSTPYKVKVIAQTDKRYQIQYDNSGQKAWVNKSSVKLNYLDKDFCVKTQRYLPNGACSICFLKSCANSGTYNPHL